MENHTEPLTVPLRIARRDLGDIARAVATTNVPRVLTDHGTALCRLVSMNYQLADNPLAIKRTNVVVRRDLHAECRCGATMSLVAPAEELATHLTRWLTVHTDPVHTDPDRGAPDTTGATTP